MPTSQSALGQPHPNAQVSQQVLRSTRCLATFQVCRRRYHAEATWGPELDDDRISRNQFGGADAEIEALRYDDETPSMTKSMWTCWYRRRNPSTSGVRISRAAVANALMRKAPDRASCCDRAVFIASWMLSTAGAT